MPPARALTLGTPAVTVPSVSVVECVPSLRTSVAVWSVERFCGSTRSTEYSIHGASAEHDGATVVPASVGCCGVRGV
ncbi:MAG: hypothetical protein MIJ73_11890 [Microbacterium aurum]|jgi:hypothetical protein